MSGSRRAFTMVELLVVLAIIGILMGLLLPALGRARARANETRCANNIREIGRALQIYRDDAEASGGRVHALGDYTFDDPPRLTDLYPRYIADQRVFLCAADRSEGAEVRPGTLSKFPEVNEPNTTHWPHTVNEHPLSYMYEFSGAQISWGWTTYVTLPDGSGDPDAFVERHGRPSHTSWAEVKHAQMRYGDTYWNADDMSKRLAYPTTRFPALRCFHHVQNVLDNQEESVWNLAFAGNVFRSTMEWELSAKGH